MISINDISISFLGKDLFKNISFQINKTDKVGLVGKNGSGKTTLLRLIMREQASDSGVISYPNGLKIGYLPQNMSYSDTKNLIDETLTAFEDFKRKKKKLSDLNNKLSEREDYESGSYQKLIDDISELSYQLSFQNENTILAETENILKGLGFSPKDFNRLTSEFSGGWRMRIEISKLLLQKPDIFLLDEPTNHLDIESIEWLEKFLLNYKGALLLISHDRRFLDKITTRTIEISNGQLYDYNASYSRYKELREERHKQEVATYDNQQNLIKQTERFIERFRAKSTKSSQVQSRIKMLEKLDTIEVEKEDTKTIHFKFPPAPRSGDIVVKAENIIKKYDNLLVLDEINFELERGEKIAFVGKNGEGKTTFARIINNEITDYTGQLKIGHNVSIGYFAQNQDKTLDKNLTVFETLEHIAVGDIRKQLRNILGAFLFSNDDIDKKVSVLSGGERARLAVAKLILQPYSFLILDEPTNHLDIPAKEVLKQALMQFDGTLLIVSHDRDFLDGLVDTTYEFTNNKIKQYKGDINYFLEKKNIQNIEQLVKKERKSNSKQKENSENKDNYIQRKEQKRKIDKIQRQIKAVETEIETIEKDIETIEKELANPLTELTPDFFENYENLKNELEIKMNNWEELTMLIDDIPNSSQN